MTERINFSSGIVSWSVHRRTLKDGTVVEQDRARLRVAHNGEHLRFTKAFPASNRLNTDRKKQIAVNNWIAELSREQEERIAAEEAEAKAKEEAERKAKRKEKIKTVPDAVDEFLDGWNVEGSRSGMMSSSFATIRISASYSSGVTGRDVGMISRYRGFSGECLCVE